MKEKQKRKRLADREAGFRRVYSAYRSRAHRLNLAWLLSTEETYLLLTSACWYCGSAPGRVKGDDETSAFVHGGIDRLDNTLGYTPANAKPACTVCNFMKGTLSLDDFFRKIEQIHAKHLDSDYGDPARPSTGWW